MNDRKENFATFQDVDFLFVNKREFNESEKEGILLLSLVANPDSLLHARCYLGLGSKDHFSKEIQAIKSEYDSLSHAIQKACCDDFRKSQKNIRRICERIEKLKTFINSHRNGALDSLIEELFPEGNMDVSEVKKMMLSLKEDEDTAQTLYGKFVDFIRTLPHGDNTIRVMTIMVSKGLEAEHVYILGCNNGYLPGKNRSTHLDDHQHKEEQRRLFYVGFTRAKRSLTVSWSRHIPFGEAKFNNAEIQGTITDSNGEPQAIVRLCDFLQDLSGINWE